MSTAVCKILGYVGTVDFILNANMPHSNMQV